MDVINRCDALAAETSINGRTSVPEFPSSEIEEEEGSPHKEFRGLSFVEPARSSTSEKA
jgi:hypothetical protein